MSYEPPTLRRCEQADIANKYRTEVLFSQLFAKADLDHVYNHFAANCRQRQLRLHFALRSSKQLQLLSDKRLPFPAASLYSKNNLSDKTCLRSGIHHK